MNLSHHAAAPAPHSYRAEEPSILGFAIVTSGAEATGWRTEEPAGDLALVRREFPDLCCRLLQQSPKGGAEIREADWHRDPYEPYRWDAQVLKLEAQPNWLVLVRDPESNSSARSALELLTRYQRLLLCFNDGSRHPTFRIALSHHRSVHDLSKPLVRADYDHALDVWQWTLRLEPQASRALQLAALFHDIERLWSEAERRVEHEALDYQAFKNAHASSGAQLASGVLEAAGVPRAERAQVAELIRAHELPHGTARDPALATLADADALSFFSLNSPGFADYYGPEHTAKKVRYTLGRMTAQARRRLEHIRLRPDIAEALRLAQAATADTPQEAQV